MMPAWWERWNRRMELMSHKGERSQMDSFIPKRPNSPGLWYLAEKELYVWVEDDHFHRTVTEWRIGKTKVSNSQLPEGYWEKAEFPARISGAYVTNQTPAENRRFLHG